MLIRSRLHQVALSANIAKMYRQIALNKGTQDFHNFLEKKKFPFLVKANLNFVILILQHFHVPSLQGGGQLTLNTSREEYWIPKGKSLVTNIIKNCVNLADSPTKFHLKSWPGLPAEIITKSRPLTSTGIDLAGPLITKPDNKTYIAVFVCFTAKATLLEIVQDLTNESCLHICAHTFHR